MRISSGLMSILIAAGFLLSAAAPARAARDPLAGQWILTMISDDSGKQVQDTVSFKIDAFTSEWAVKQGFKDPMKFESDSRGLQAITFTVAAKSGKAEVKWTGSAALGEISGTIAWTKADGSAETFTFKGKRVEK